ncbi:MULTISPECIES: hypothetical protein [unclassified Mycolicibacterium]|uniref:hypothetical protein n=1 Tax=unclassified Mycolicibacterium TaxID=2636767 RepID=UPI0012DC4804|nr:MULTISPECIES: hypothetical protein [unclassified Mycolicibacterium]MUL83076.1 hypothetical protein [Mycolicibacterium sp. CBMA 329]MUL89411.1 hypothetical protein [Mycolicibacterium sp. CBMA 331]MUL99100.1 hypothetical protein [Mycolicibacterium sp. CBMA 334]MUM24726.1 hypothetical protein [Mycolicibacterium sp. CBMA 295]MUM38927.1 hypothetical protein [Mycolicibacterium sp. CBMA 247]
MNHYTHTRRLASAFVCAVSTGTEQPSSTASVAEAPLYTSLPDSVKNTLVFMDDGVIVESGNLHSVMQNPRSTRTREFISRVL